MSGLSPRARGYVLAITAVTIFALTLPATRIAVGELPASFVGLGRAAVAAIVAAGSRTGVASAVNP